MSFELWVNEEVFSIDRNGIIFEPSSAMPLDTKDWLTMKAVHVRELILLMYAKDSTIEIVVAVGSDFKPAILYGKCDDKLPDRKVIGFRSFSSCISALQVMAELMGVES